MRSIREMEDFAKSQNAVEEIYAERRRQVDSEGWSDDHDDSHTHGELAEAAACYARVARLTVKEFPPHTWPWARQWWKPSDRRRMLVKAGALIIAEIERLDRAERLK